MVSNEKANQLKHSIHILHLWLGQQPIEVLALEVIQSFYFFYVNVEYLDHIEF